MKKLFMTMISVLACGAAFALPVGNPSDASLLCDGVIWEGHCGDPCDPCLTMCDSWSIRVGFYGDYVFNRHLEVDNDNNGQNYDIEHTEIYTNAGLIAFNLWDRFDIFATLGASTLYIDTNARAFLGTPGQRFELETETDFSWSIGARATIWECGCTSFGIEGQYFYTKPDIKRITTAATYSAYVDDQFDAKYREWQIGIGVSHRINLLVPYVAVKWAGAKLDLDDAVISSPSITLWDAESKKVWGFAVGVSLVDCEKVSLTVEGRFADEKAVHVNGQIRF
ncbi:MAG: Major outer membrane porin [Chlamydiae bacterium]|nr:Major outer membrane porin [Chlamydiota bacterium]